MKRMGLRIKKRREMLNISLSKLASDIGVSPSLLSQIENGKAFPSIVTLKKISDYLHTTVSELIGEKENLSINLLINTNTLDPYKIFESGAKLYYLNKQLQDKFIDIYQIELEPLSNIDLTNLSHNSQEFFYILEGEVKLIIKEQEIILKKGDGYYNYLNIDKKFINIINNKSKILWTVTTDLINLYHSIIEK